MSRAARDAKTDGANRGMTRAISFAEPAQEGCLRQNAYAIFTNERTLDTIACMFRPGPGA